MHSTCTPKNTSSQLEEDPISGISPAPLDRIMLRPLLRVAPRASLPRRFKSKISRYEGMHDYMSLAQMQLIRDRLARDACGVGTVVSADTFFYMIKRVSSDLGIHDDGLRKLVGKVDANGDGAARRRSERGARARRGPPRGAASTLRSAGSAHRAPRTAARRRHDPVRRVRGVRRSQGERSGQAADHGHGQDLRDPRAAPRGPRRRRLGDLRGHARRTRPTIGRIRFDSGPPGSPVDLGAGSS